MMLVQGLATSDPRSCDITALGFGHGLPPVTPPSLSRATSFLDCYRLLCGWIQAAALTVTCCAFTSGCVPIPVLKSTSFPDVEAKLPADLRGSGDQVLVARQVSSESSSAVVVQVSDKRSKTLTVDFMKASDLVSFSKTLKLESQTGLVLALPYSKFGVGGLTSERLEKVCVVTGDGRVITLGGNGADREPVFLDAGRRDAIVAALSAGGTTPFVGVDGPCGVSGTAEWPVELRSRVIDFLLRIPAVNPRVATSDLVSNDVLAMALRDSWTTGAQAGRGKGGAMLLVSGVWRGAPIAERPRFLPAEEFDRFSTSRATVNIDAIITLLPTYESWSYDPSSVSVASFCLISADGRAISASGRSHLESPNTRPRLAHWRDGAIAHLRSGSGSFDPEFPCIPPDTHLWSDADQTAAIEFLAAIPAPAAARADASLPAVSDAAAAGVLVLAVISAQGGTVIVPTLMASDDVAAVVSAIRSHTPSEFTALIAPFEDQSLDYVCVIALDGQVISFGSSGMYSWRGSNEFSFSDQSIRDAIASVGNTATYHGSFICSLEKAVRWPEDVRSQVIGFLNRIPIGK